MAIERRTFVGKIPLPFSRTEVPTGEIDLIRPQGKYNGKIIELEVTSPNSLSYIQDISQEKSPPVRATISRYPKKEAINKANIRIQRTRFKNRKYTWKED